MRRLWFLLAALGAALTLMPTANAASIVGWWTRSPVASAPEGGVAVASAPDGPTSVAAILVDLGDGASRARLTLHQSGGAAPAGANLDACIVGAFSPTAGGPIEKAPATTCRGASVPVVVGGGETWTAELTELLGRRTGRVGVAIVPAPGSGLWDLQFDRADVAVTGGVADTSAPDSEPELTPLMPESQTAAPEPFPESDPYPPTSVPAAVAPTITVAGSSSNAAAPRQPDTTPVARPNMVAFVLLAAVIGVGGGLAHKAITGRLSASFGDVPS